MLMIPNMNDLFTQPNNVPEFSVSDLAFSLKRTLEDTYGRVRVRGELSRISIPKSGHLYTGLKDENAVLDAVCWKGVLSRLSIRPEEGLEVICIGKITTFPKSSKYQLVIESMELAGEGALLKMLEERKKKLAAEGLFSAERKKPIPFLPETIGVVTSPTGAVIRDILHRLHDRFPRHVIVWPVKVQGEGAEEEITNGINGFNTAPEEHKPDVIIVARGGGSLEDLMAFNAESVVRATANSTIPIISAVGHETDTTLIDYAADLRAPTPTGAAELAVPVRINLMAQVAEGEHRLISATNRLINEKNTHVTNLSARLGDPNKIIDLKTQNLDYINSKLEHAFDKNLRNKKEKLLDTASRLLHPAQSIEQKKSRLDNLCNRLNASFQNTLMIKENQTAKTISRLKPPDVQIENLKSVLNYSEEKLENSKNRVIENKENTLKSEHEKLELLSFKNVLNRGFVVVRDKNGKPVTNGTNLSDQDNIELEFKNDQKIRAHITKDIQTSLF